MHGKQKELTLDYFILNKEINNLIRIEQRGNSDHYPLMIDFKISGANNILRIYAHCNPNRQPTQDQQIKLWNSGWPLKDYKENHKNLYTTINLRQKVFLTAKKINLFKSNEWIDIWEIYKLINKEEYANFIEEIWSYEKSNIKQFYKTLNRLLRYKEKGNVVKKINKNGGIQTSETSTKIWLKYYSELLKSDENLTKIYLHMKNLTL